MTRGPERPYDVHRRGISAFLLIAFGLAWLPFLPALFGRDPFLIGMPFAPLIAAVITRRWVTREGFADAGLRPNLRRWRLYLIAIAWPFATTILSVAIAWAFGLAPDDASVPWGVRSPESQQLLGWLLASIVLAPILFGEEFGWRGYLQIKLFAGQPLKAAIATGLIWAVWHYPMILVGGQNTVSRYWALALFPVFAVILSIFLGWLRARTGSVWAPSVAHASNNGAEDSWHRLAFMGRTDGVASLSADLVLILAEAVVLVGIVTGDRLLGRRAARAIRSDRPGNADFERALVPLHNLK